MATRFYLSSTESVVGVTPGFAAWTRTTEGLRRRMSLPKDGSAITSTTFWANGAAAANESALARQFISDPMAAGIAFLATDTIKAQVLCQESGTNDNIDRQPICVKVYSQDGTTLRATMLALGHVGPNTTEWLNTGPRNKTVADGDLLTDVGVGYTTVAGDRLVIELGGQASSAGGTTVTGTQWYGSANASDLGENETDTATTLNPWFEISRNLTFLTPEIRARDLSTPTRAIMPTDRLLVATNRLPLLLSAVTPFKQLDWARPIVGQRRQPEHIQNLLLSTLGVVVGTTIVRPPLIMTRVPVPRLIDTTMPNLLTSTLATPAGPPAGSLALLGVGR